MKIAIIGGGASGLFLASLLEGITLFEGKDRVGKKLLATGNGRCNLSNQQMSLDHFHGNKKLAQEVFSRASQEEVFSHFHLMGLDTLRDDRNRIYPRTLQASTVLNVLRRHAEEKNDIRTGIEVEKVQAKNKGFTLTLEGGEREDYDLVVLATGGKTMPKSGSRGQGYALAKALGHHLTPIFPALVQVKTKDPFLKHLQGVKVEGVLELWINGKKKDQKTGEILITNYGLSGPPVLDLSRQAVEAYLKKEKVDFRFSLLNGMEDLKEAFTYVQERTYQFYPNSLEEFLEGLVHKKFIHVVLKNLNLSPDVRLEDLAYQDLEKFWKILAQYKMEMTGFRKEDQAQITCGGVSGEEIDGRGESLLHPGLFFIGELVDVDGDCGGYNLQWAWSSALSCAKAIKEKEDQKGF